MATLTTALVYVQILVGAIMRHTGAGLAIPDFPWMFGHIVPEDEDLQLLRATRPPQQPHQREQVPHNEIHERPEQAALPRPRQERRT